MSLRTQKTALFTFKARSRPDIAPAPSGKRSVNTTPGFHTNSYLLCHELLTGVSEFAGAVLESSVHVGISDDFSAILQPLLEQLIVQICGLLAGGHVE
jgi:hypothetical protein